MDKFITLVSIFQAICLYMAVVADFTARRSEAQAADWFVVGSDAGAIDQIAITGLREIRNGFLWVSAVIGTIVAFVNIYIAHVA